MRHHWAEGDLALWDGHAVQHYAVADYASRRVMQRVLTEGPRPIAVGETARSDGNRAVAIVVTRRAEAMSMTTEASFTADEVRELRKLLEIEKIRKLRQ